MMNYTPKDDPADLWADTHTLYMGVLSKQTNPNQQDFFALLHITARLISRMEYAISQYNQHSHGRGVEDRLPRWEDTVMGEWTTTVKNVNE